MLQTLQPRSQEELGHHQESPAGPARLLTLAASVCRVPGFVLLSLFIPGPFSFALFLVYSKTLPLIFNFMG